MIKIKNILLAGLLISGFALSAQKAILNPFVGYTFQNRFDISGGEAKLQDGLTYGATLAFPISQNNAIEILYSRQESRLEAHSVFLDVPYYEDVAVNYIMIGGKKVFPGINEDFQYYGGMRMGVGVFSSTTDSYNSITRFAAGINLGFAYYLSEVVGLHGGLNMNFPITDVGAGLGWSSSGGASVGVSGWSPIVQFTFIGGLTMRLGN